MRNGAFTSISASVPDFQGAACWVAVGGGGPIRVRGEHRKQRRLGIPDRPRRVDLAPGPDGVTAAAGAAPADVAEVRRPRAVYVRNGGDGSISSYRERYDGSLVPNGTVSGIPAGASGLAAE